MNKLKAIGYYKRRDSLYFFSKVDSYSYIELYAGNENLVRIDIDEGIQNLLLWQNKLEALTTPSSCRNLFVENNLLKELVLNDGIVEVTCFNNHLTYLEIPDSCQIVECSNNKLESLNLSEGIERLDCSGNRIKKLDLPLSLKNLKCDKGVELNRLDLAIAMV